MIIGCLAFVALASSGHGLELGSGRLEIRGARLTLSPSEQTVAVDTEARVIPRLESTGPNDVEPSAEDREIALPPGLRVLGDLSGPGIEGVLVLETVPGKPFSLPALELAGEYRLEDVWLVMDEKLVVVAEPSSAVIVVQQSRVMQHRARELAPQNPER